MYKLAGNIKVKVFIRTRHSVSERKWNIEDIWAFTQGAILWTIFLIVYPLRVFSETVNVK